MGQISNIKDGWVSFLKKETAEEAKRRASICQECPHAVVGTYEKFMPDNSLKEIQGLKCDVCECPLSTKLRAKDAHCPLGKW